MRATYSVGPSASLSCNFSSYASLDSFVILKSIPIVGISFKAFDKDFKMDDGKFEEDEKVVFVFLKDNE